MKLNELTLLLIDGDSDFQSILPSILGSWFRCRIICRSDIMGALDCLRHEPQVNLIICEARLADGSVAALMRETLELRQPPYPIVVFAEKHAHIPNLVPEGLCFIEKPNFMELARGILDTLGYRPTPLPSRRSTDTPTTEE